MEQNNRFENKSSEEQGLDNIQDKFKCRITVRKKVFHEDLYQQYPYGGAHACGRFEEGQVFITNNRWDPPDGFCHWAWADLRSIIQSIHSGHPTTMISCCTDGLRPVTFKFERIDS
ncbi:MAG: TIGR04076 family protein [Chloroflexi bacterium]|nr:TIGR04076 family protein [Chloroflexota bacterium]